MKLDMNTESYFLKRNLHLPEVEAFLSPVNGPILSFQASDVVSSKVAWFCLPASLHDFHHHPKSLPRPFLALQSQLDLFSMDGQQATGCSWLYKSVLGVETKQAPSTSIDLMYPNPDFLDG